MEVDPGSVLESLGSARRYADPQGPRQGRLLAARGALPLPPAQIAGVLYALTLDPDAEIRDRASASLEELPDRIVDAALEGEVHPGLLAHYAERERDNEARIEKIAQQLAQPLSPPQLPDVSDDEAWVSNKSQGEYERTGFQGGLQWYRCGTDEHLAAELQLFSGRAIARKLESAYEAMWRRYLAGAEPDHIEVASSSA